MQLVNIIKPTHRCNLFCKYCYNEDARNPIMSSGVLDKTIYETFEYFRKIKAFSQVHFIWHGGEPTLAGIDFYKQVVMFQKNMPMEYLISMQSKQMEL